MSASREHRETLAVTGNKVLFYREFLVVAKEGSENLVTMAMSSGKTRAWAVKRG